MPYMNQTQYANHIMHLRKLIKNATRNRPLLEKEILVGLITLEHHNNALEAQVETIECMSVTYGRRG